MLLYRLSGYVQCSLVGWYYLSPVTYKADSRVCHCVGRLDMDSLLPVYPSLANILCFQDTGENCMRPASKTCDLDIQEGNSWVICSLGAPQCLLIKSGLYMEGLIKIFQIQSRFYLEIPRKPILDKKKGLLDICKSAMCGICVGMDWQNPHTSNCLDILHTQCD